jgi:YebC/PmpR family DNA-binding regulatory protein
MSGHSKWSTIKHKKAAEDAKRGKLFTRLGREIAVATREGGGGDPETNFRLRIAMDNAKEANMPKDNIERAILRGLGKSPDGGEIEEVLYEAYGPNGVAIMINTQTDNRNRTIADIKRVLNRNNGSMAEPGSVAWQFEQMGYIALNSADVDFDEVFMAAAEAGAEDVDDDGEVIEIFTPRELLFEVVGALEEDAGVTKTEEARLEWVPQNKLDLETEQTRKVMNLIDQLDELDDTDRVFSNLNITDEVIAMYESEAAD